MRLVGVAAIVFTLALTFAMSEFAPATTAHQHAGLSGDNGERNRNDGERNHRNGQAIFRYDTFGDDGSAPDLLAVVNHYDHLLALIFRPHRKPISSNS
jgi:hypothetical protein